MVKKKHEHIINMKVLENSWELFCKQCKKTLTKLNFITVKKKTKKKVKK